MNKRGQIWVETVLYVLIALIMIGAVLAFINPKIKQIQDKLTLDKTAELLEELDAKIAEVSEGVGNKRTVSVEIKKGELEINPTDITYTLEESAIAYSEPVTKESGFIKYNNDVLVKTVKTGDVYNVELKIEIPSSIQIDYITTGKLAKSSSSYKLAITNKGGVGTTKIEIELIL